MNSAIAEAIGLETHPVALIWADEAPPEAIRFKHGRWGCVINVFAAVATQGRAASYA